MIMIGTFSWWSCCTTLCLSLLSQFFVQCHSHSYSRCTSGTVRPSKTASVPRSVADLHMICTRAMSHLRHWRVSMNAAQNNILCGYLTGSKQVEINLWSATLCQVLVHLQKGRLRQSWLLTGTGSQSCKSPKANRSISLIS